MDYYCLSQHRPIYIYTILPIIVCIVIYVIFAMYYRVEHKTEFKEAFCRTINQSKLMIVILTIIVSLMLIGGDIMLITFNNSNWWFTENTRISKKIGDWGDFATCLTAIFSLISIFYAYRAFRKQSESLEQAKETLKSQSNAAKRASFDATFTQIFAQHKILYDKAIQHGIKFTSRYDGDDVTNADNNIFAYCKNEYKKFLNSTNSIRHIDLSYITDYINLMYTNSTDYIARTNDVTYNISTFWESFNERIGSSVSVDFKNYLKYIHNEVEFVAGQPDDILDNDAKQRYIQLIQAQMNNDELLCYLINKVEFMYRQQPNLEEDTKIHAVHLRKFKFFIELCRGKSGHVDFVEMMLRDKGLNVSAFIDAKWILR